MNRFPAFCVAAATVFATCASAEVLYKLIDKNGKVTYSESKPEKFDGQVIRIDVDPKANTMAAPKAPVTQAPKGETTKAESENERIIRRRIVTKDDRLQAARDKVDAARKAFEDARDNPTEADVAWMSRGAIPLNPPAGAPPDPNVKPGTPKPPPAPPGFNPTLPTPGQKPLGARPVPTDEYTARLASLEKAWHDAEDELAALEKELR